ncbi:MAG: DUF3810 domain-containing protein [Mobilitalea sp.]
MKKYLKYKRSRIILLLPLSYLLTFIAKKNSGLVENIFSRYIYKWISQIISAVTGIFPFSVAEVMSGVLFILLVAVGVRYIIDVTMEENEEKKMERKRIGYLNVLCSASVIVFLFVILAGLNYYRYPFIKYMNIELQDSTIQELSELTESLTLQANELRKQIPKTDEDGVFQLSMNNYELAEITDDAFSLLSEKYPILKGNYGKAKPVIFSKVMSKTEITGIFFPFTMEANVNIDISDYTIPSTMLHELAHLRGFMREDEANYLAYLAGINSENIELQYSSTMLALITAGNALYRQNAEMYYKNRDLYSEGVVKDIIANSEYWQQYDDTVISNTSDKINDTYLKANNQTDGVKSYGRMLDILLAQYRTEQENESK